MSEAESQQTIAAPDRREVAPEALARALKKLKARLPKQCLVTDTSALKPFESDGLTALREVPWLVALPLVAVWAYLLDGIFIGATRTDAMQYTMLLCSGLVYLPAWYATRSWGNDGLWFAFLLFNLARGMSMGACFAWFNHSQRW